jgi:phenylalanyl-tRNA synthetase alpha chain
MQKDLNTIVADVREKTPAIKTRAEFEAYKATISGPKGVLTDVMKGMGKVPKEDKPAMGKAINEAKMAVEAAFASVIEGLEAAELAAKIGPGHRPHLAEPRFRLAAIYTQSLKSEKRWWISSAVLDFLSPRPPK